MHRVFALQTETHEGKLRVFVLLDEADEALVLSESFFFKTFLCDANGVDRSSNLFPNTQELTSDK